MASARRGDKRVRLVARRRIWALGAVAVVAIVGFGALAVQPLVNARTDDGRVTRTVAILQRVSELRTAVSAWQVYLQPHFGDFSATQAKVVPEELAKGAVLAQTQSTSALSLIAILGAEGFPSSAKQLQAANTNYTASIVEFTHIDRGASANLISTTIADETAAFTEMLAVTSATGDQLRAQVGGELQSAIRGVQSSRRTLLIADALLAALVLGGAIVFGERARGRERADRSRSERQAFETTVQDALEMAKTESDAYAVMMDALRRSVPRLQVEMLVADSSRSHFHQTVDTRGGAETPRSGCGVVSPSDCPATRRSHALVFHSSRALNACPNLRGRPSGELSAACIPISITGRMSGVVHATAPDGAPPTTSETHYLETTSRLAADRIALVRTFEKSEAQARTDPLTGLLNRRSFENRVHDLRRDGTPYTLAYGDLDHFKVLNDTHGHEAGDKALRLFARVLRDSIRPDDISARYGGEEFVIVLPECPMDTAMKVLERLREQLALALTTGRCPSFTVSFGLASSVDANTFDEVVAVADQALLTAKRNGRNRTVRAAPAAPQTAELGRP